MTDLLLPPDFVFKLVLCHVGCGLVPCGIDMSAHNGDGSMFIQVSAAIAQADVPCFARLTTFRDFCKRARVCMCV